MNTKHIGSSLEDFLAEEGLLGEAAANAMMRVIAWQSGGFNPQVAGAGIVPEGEHALRRVLLLD